MYQESRRYLNHQDKVELKRILFSLYSKYKSGFFSSKKQKFSNISKEELEALKTLSADKNLVISKPDKGNGRVIMDKLDYISKMKLIVCDRTKFQPVDRNINLQQLQNSQQFLASLKKCKAIDDEVYQRIRPISVSTPTLYDRGEVENTRLEAKAKDTKKSEVKTKTKNSPSEDRPSRGQGPRTLTQVF